jgi:hypothetical protein
VGKLTDAAREQFTRSARAKEIPVWVPRAGVALGGCVALIMLFDAVRPSPVVELPPEQVVPPVTTPGPPTDPVPGGTQDQPETPGPTGPPGGVVSPTETTTVPSVDGVEVTVPTAAVAAADAAAVALLTGDFTGVEVPAWFVAPEPVDAPAPSVVGRTVVLITPPTVSGQVVTLDVVVDTDSDGPAPPRVVTVTVAGSGDRFVFRP